MNVGITFGGPDAVDINFNEGRVIFCNIHIIKPCHAPRGPFGKGIEYNCTWVLQYIF